MEGTSLLSLHSYSLYPHISSKPQLRLYAHDSFHLKKFRSACLVPNLIGNNRAMRHYFLPRSSLRTPESKVEETSEVSSELMTLMPKIDKNGKFCSPRAAREFSLSVVYAACLEGSDPVQLFEKRVNARRDPGYNFDKASLLEYNHMSFGGIPVTAETLEEADELLHKDEKESTIEEEVLSAPPKLVYNRLILRFARKLLVAVVDKWDSHVVVINKIAPPNWKSEPASKILEFSILHMAMSEITVVGTPHQIVINEAVDLAKRFCDGAAPRIINGCLRTFVRDFSSTGIVKVSKSRNVPLTKA